MHGKEIRVDDYTYTFDTNRQGWHVAVTDRHKTTYGLVLPELDGFPVVSLGSQRWGRYYSQGLFENCCELIYLPPDFAIPPTVDNVSSMFYNCYALSFLPDSFSFPPSVLIAHSVFWNCTALSVLPDAFSLPQNATNLNFFFRGCIFLKALPNTLTLPPSAITATEFFLGCHSLKIIPKNFSVPKDCKTKEMFRDCPSLECVPPKLRYKKYF